MNAVHGGLLRRSACALLALAASCATLSKQDPAHEVAGTERAFARTMADRDGAAFGRFVADEAIFMSGSTVLRGKAHVVGHWARFFTSPAAPFSWEPDQVEVLASGTLAFSSGPVRDAQGRTVGRFNSVWRREAPGEWRIVFDKGSDFCPCDATLPK